MEPAREDLRPGPSDRSLVLLGLWSLLAAPALGWALAAAALNGEGRSAVLAILVLPACLAYVPAAALVGPARALLPAAGAAALGFVALIVTVVWAATHGVFA